MCVCSPGVVQRGTAALFPARVRTRAALAAGADLVLSLPAPLRYAVRRGLCSGGCGAAECAGLCGCSVLRHRDTAAGGYRPNRSAAGKPGLSSAAGPAARAAGRGAAPAARRRRKRCVREQARCCARPMTSWAWNTVRPCCASTAHLCLCAAPAGARPTMPLLDAAPGRYAWLRCARWCGPGSGGSAPHVPPACLRLYMQAEAEGDIRTGRVRYCGAVPPAGYGWRVSAPRGAAEGWRTGRRRRSGRRHAG